MVEGVWGIGELGSWDRGVGCLDLGYALCMMSWMAGWVGVLGGLGVLEEVLLDG